MNNLTNATERIADFIFKKPEVVVAILAESGYDISVDNATLHRINELTLSALYNNKEPFTTKFREEISKNF
jgi:hypothetical protein